jgi:hypothetical protein
MKDNIITYKNQYFQIIYIIQEYIISQTYLYAFIHIFHSYNTENYRYQIFKTNQTIHK